MSVFNESRVLSQVNALPAKNSIDVQWTNIVTKDGIEISKTYERKSYGQDQAQSFASEVTGAAGYMSAMGWN